MAAAPHGISAYRSGCRCAVCRNAASAARRRQRAATPDAPREPRNVVVGLPAAHQSCTAPTEMGPNETAVRAELEILPRAAERPAIAAAAVTLGQRLDDPGHAALTARNAHELRDLLQILQGPRKKSAGRLTVVTAMSARRKAAQ